MTLAQALEDLAEYGERGVMPNHARWLYQVTGLLALDPEAAGRFAEQALTAGTTTQTLALDVLAQVETPHGQAAAVHMLHRTEFRDGPNYGRMVQSLLLVRSPTEETMRATLALADHVGPGQLGATNVLGSIAAEWRDGGRDERPIVERLERGTRDADPVVREAHVLALGNASSDHGLSAIAVSAADDTPSVRRAAARALRHYAPSDRSVDTLSTLGRDDDPLVRAAAIDALVSMGTDESAREALIAIPSWEPLAVDRLVTGLEAQGADAADMLALVERLLVETDGLAPGLRERIRRLRIYGQPT